VKILKVKDLIEELKRLQQDKFVEIGSPTDDFGVVERVVEYSHYVEIQSDKDLRD
jgi:hypothetical protein